MSLLVLVKFCSSLVDMAAFASNSSTSLINFRICIVPQILCIFLPHPLLFLPLFLLTCWKFQDFSNPLFKCLMHGMWFRGFVNATLNRFGSIVILPHKTTLSNLDTSRMQLSVWRWQFFCDSTVFIIFFRSRFPSYFCLGLVLMSRLRPYSSYTPRTYIPCSTFVLKHWFDRLTRNPMPTNETKNSLPSLSILPSLLLSLFLSWICLSFRQLSNPVTIFSACSAVSGSLV